MVIRISARAQLSLISLLAKMRILYEPAYDEELENFIQGRDRQRESDMHLGGITRLLGCAAHCDDRHLKSSDLQSCSGGGGGGGAGGLEAKRLHSFHLSSW